jgi:hypothetical protein
MPYLPFESSDWLTTMYINGEPHRITHLGMSFFADSPDLPLRRCSHHTLKAASVEHVKNGGNSYSLKGAISHE